MAWLPPAVFAAILPDFNVGCLVLGRGALETPVSTYPALSPGFGWEKEILSRGENGCIILI
jgi:hypothetical protein